MIADTPFGMPKLPRDWTWKILDELSERVSVGHVGETSSVFCGKEGVTFLRSQNVRPGKVELNDVKFVTKEFHEKSKKSQLKAGDILIVRVGQNRGDCAVVPEGLGELNCANIVFSRPNKKYSEFLGYFFNSSFGRAALLAVSTGSAQGVLNTKSIAKVPIPVPPEDVAENIGKYLKALDNKIALNRQINQTLEYMAQAIFKSWFVDFEPVKAKIAALESGEDTEGVTRAAMRAISGKTDDELDQMQAGQPDNYAQLKTTAGLFPAAMQDSELGKVPEGWEVKQIGDVVKVVGGGTPSTKNSAFWDGGSHCWTTPKDLSGISSHVLLDTVRKITDAGLAKISCGLLPVGTFLLSSRAPVGYTAIAKVPLAVNQGYIAIPPGGQLSSIFLLHWTRVNLEIIKGRACGTTFQEISKKNFRPIKIAVATTEILNHFDRAVGRLFERIVANEQESHSLTAIRDALLPKLMSGKIRVK